MDDYYFKNQSQLIQKVINDCQGIADRAPLARNDKGLCLFFME
jgi:hypothetical protein